MTTVTGRLKSVDHLEYLNTTCTRHKQWAAHRQQHTGPRGRIAGLKEGEGKNETPMSSTGKLWEGRGVPVDPRTTVAGLWERR